MEELEFHRRLSRPGTLVDAGAHDGGLTLPLAALPGARVIAFEPLPTAFARLQGAFRAAYGGTVPAHVALRQMALGAAAGEIVLEVPVVGGVAQEQWASVVKDYEAIRADDPRIDAIRRVTVQVQALDALELADVTAIKIDVEGAEEEVLRGATSTLLRCRPILSIEIEERHRPGSLRAVPALLAGLGYRGFYEFWGEWRPVDGFDPALMQRGSASPAAFEVSDPYVFCFYFVPADRVAELAQLARLPD
jgi:FkbM family methyltransferase